MNQLLSGVSSSTPPLIQPMQGYENDNESASTRNGSEVESPQLSSRLPFFQRLFCCGRRALSSKQYGSNYRNGDENFGIAAEKDGVRNKLQSFGSVPRDSLRFLSSVCPSVRLID